LARALVKILLVLSKLLEYSVCDWAEAAAPKTATATGVTIAAKQLAKRLIKSLFGQFFVSLG
jgi:hypothetical protein